VNRHPPIVSEDVDYLVEDNAMDDICLSPELDGASGMPLLNITANSDTSEKGDSRKNGAAMNSSWEQNASA
jgi:DNA-directed RNA polymerase-5 subunit 1